jgi:chromosome segregation ATPase
MDGPSQRQFRQSNVASFQENCKVESVAAESLRKIYESEIKNLESKAYQSQIKMEKELKDHEIQVKEYQSKIKGLQEKYDVDIVAQQQINNDLKMIIANLENKLKICQKSNQDLLEIEQYGSQTEFSTLLRELKNKQNEVGEYQSEIIDLQNKYNHAHAVALPHVINASKKQIEDLQKDNESLKNGLKIHQMMSLEVNDSQPQPHFRARGGTNFEGIENEFQSKFSHIEERYKQETSVYQERIKDLMESNENLKKDNENFISCIVDLKEDAKNLKKDDENLKAKLKDLQERYKIELNGYRERLVDLREDNKNLKKEDENLKDKLKDLQERHIKETYAYQKYIKATEKDKEDMKLVGLKTQKESDQVFLKELKKYQSEINDLQEKLKQSQSQVKDLQEKFEKESDARQFAESMKEIHASQVNVVEFGMKSKLMKLQEQSIGEKKHCQSQIDDLQKKYTKEISSHKLTESQKETFRLKLEGLVIREKEYQSNVRDLQEKLKKESTDQQKLKNLIIELRYKLNEIEVECKQSQCQVKDLQEKCKKESEAQQLAESLKEIYASQVNVVEFEMKWCQSELKKLQENSIGDKKNCQSQIDDLQEKYRKEISAHQLTKSQNETYKLGLEYQTRREREYQSTIMNLKKQGPWGRGGP